MHDSELYVTAKLILVYKISLDKRNTSHILEFIVVSKFHLKYINFAILDMLLGYLYFLTNLRLDALIK